MTTFDLFGRPVPGLARALASEAGAGAFARANGHACAGDRLETLPWFPFDVAASPSCRRTATRIARRAERAYWVLRQALDFAPRLRLLVLDRGAWSAHADAAEFGVMHVNRSGDLVVGAKPADAWSGIST